MSDPPRRGEGLSCGTCPEERRCSFVSVSALPPPRLNFSQFDHSCHSLCLSLCLTSLHFYIPTHHFCLIFPDFAYSPSTCQPSKFLSNCQNCVRKHFSYLYISFAAFSAASSFKWQHCWNGTYSSKH